MKKLFIAAMTAALFAGTAGSAFGQIGNPNGGQVATSAIAIRIGVIIVCNVNVNAGFIQVNDANANQIGTPPENNPPGGNANNISGSGTASFQAIASTTTPVASSTYAPVTLSFSGSDPTYGAFNFSFDASRPPTNSTVTANQAGADFPASADIYANVTGTVNGLPGTYTNTSECHMSATINSWNPQTNETYTFVNDVTFADVNDPTAPTFTIPAGTTVSLN
jgi:hypothetical protein